MAALPAAVVVSEQVGAISLVQAGAAIPVAAVLAVAAIVLARRARRRAERTLGRVGGERTARVGRILGWLGLYLAATATIALASYAVLELRYGG